MMVAVAAFAVYLATWRFFFSSRGRHTRSLRDWSSDVCSSDLVFSVCGTVMLKNSLMFLVAQRGIRDRRRSLPELRGYRTPTPARPAPAPPESRAGSRAAPRSEERRVGQEGVSRAGTCPRRRAA